MRPCKCLPRSTKFNFLTKTLNGEALTTSRFESVPVKKQLCRSSQLFLQWGLISFQLYIVPILLRFRQICCQHWTKEVEFNSLFIHPFCIYSIIYSYTVPISPLDVWSSKFMNEKRINSCCSDWMRAPSEDRYFLISAMSYRNSMNFLKTTINTQSIIAWETFSIVWKHCNCNQKAGEE